jgi:hypothetical protein
MKIKILKELSIFLKENIIRFPTTGYNGLWPDMPQNDYQLLWKRIILKSFTRFV